MAGKAKKNEIVKISDDLQVVIDTVLKRLISGESGDDIAESLKLNKRDGAIVEDAIINALLKAARIKPENVKGWCILSLKDIYHKMYMAEDYKGAAKVLKDIHQIANR